MMACRGSDAGVHFRMPQIDASSLRRELFDVLRNLTTSGPVAIRRNGHVVAVMSTPTNKPAAKPRVDPRRLARICKKHHIQRLSLFGSVVRGDFGPSSDVDILYEPEPGHLGTLSSFTAASDAMADLFGRRVDFVKRSLIKNSKNPYRKKSILEDERVIYEGGRVTLGGVLA